MVAVAGPGWALAPSLVALYAEVDALFPARPTASDGTIGDADHQARDSDHNPHVFFGGKYYVTASDLTDWDPTFDVDAWGERLRVRRDPRVKYFIADGRFFSSYATRTRKAWTWVPYSGPNGHFKHGHLSVLATSIGLFSTAPWIQEDELTDEDLAKIRTIVREEIDARIDALTEKTFAKAIAPGQKTWAETAVATLTNAQRAVELLENK